MTTFAEYAARQFEPPVRRWPSPLAMAQALDPSTVRTPALDLIDSALVDVADGRCTRLMVFMPPQEGKSAAVSRRFPVWLLSTDPTLRIGIVSYGADLAETFGRTMKRDVEMHADQLGIQLRRDSRAAGRWDTEQGGGLYCVGLAGGYAGRPADLIVYDDVIKDRAQAESAAHRQHAWDHWESVGRPRLSTGGKVICLLTRWHRDDLPGRLLEREPDLWRVISIPAIAEDNDPLGRLPGEELVSARRRPPGYFLDLQARMAAYAFRSIYQQQPADPKGSLFPRDGWRFWNWHRWPDLISLDGGTVDLRDCWRFLTCDLAASKRTSADWTVGAAWALTLDRRLICLGRVRDRCAEGGHWDLIRPLAVEWRAPDVGVESTMMGTTLVRQAVRAGLAPFDLHADADKVTRAIPAGHMVRQGQVWLPAGADWLDSWVGELADFPSGAHDDQADVMAYAAKLVHGWHPPGQRGGTTRPAEDPFDRQMADALGHGPNGHDPLDSI